MHRHSAVQSPSGRGMCRITVEVPIGRILQGTVVGGHGGNQERKEKRRKGRGRRKNTIALLTSLCLSDKMVEDSPHSGGELRVRIKTNRN
jgi:hypothetical protein